MNSALKRFYQIALVISIGLCVYTLKLHATAEKENLAVRYMEEKQAMLGIKSAFLSGWEMGYKQAVVDTDNNKCTYRITNEDGVKKLWKSVCMPDQALQASIKGSDCHEKK